MILLSGNPEQVTCIRRLFCFIGCSRSPDLVASFFLRVKIIGRILFPVLAALLTFVVQQDPFFWDTVQLASKHAHFFYESGLKWGGLPENIDSGHPPLLGYYLAFCWTLFGKTLVTSHWAMFPFVWLNLELMWKLSVRVAGATLAVFAFAVLSADPVWFTQHILCSPDVLVFSGMLLVVEGHFSSGTARIIGILLLSMSSMRGMMTAAALGVWEVCMLVGPLFTYRRAFDTLAVYIPGAVLAVIFLWWHREVSGWTGYHPDSPWAAAFQQTDLAGFWRNVLVTCWRWLDFGRAGVWIVFGLLIWRGRGVLEEIYNRSREWVLLFVCLLLFLTPSALIYRNLSAHRYFLPVFFAFNLLVIALLAGERLMSERMRRAMLLVTGLIFISGHFWIYPFGISNDWDCTAVHRQFHGLRRDAVAWLSASGGELSDTGTSFPVLNSGEMVELNGDGRLFSAFEPGRNRRVLISNISNDFSQETERNLAESMELAWEKHAGQLWIKIYRTTGSAKIR